MVFWGWSLPSLGGLFFFIRVPKTGITKTTIMVRFFISILLIHGCLSFGFTQKNELPQLQPSFMAIIVTNIDSSVNWYQEMLGFEVENRMDLADRGIWQSNLKNEAMRLELIQTSSMINSEELLSKRGSKVKLTGFFKIGFTVKDFDSQLSFLESKKANFHGRVVEDMVSGKRMLIVLDPDGNRIQLFEQ
ncbi:MAG: VOC family protein [Bacteroidetes bacterium]|nr:MAG: VOC family protein [Bacteroidota bacterium]